MSILDTMGILDMVVGPEGLLLYHVIKPSYEFIILVQLTARNYRKIA